MLVPIMMTKAEAKVVDALFRIGSIKEVAAQLGISYSTVRLHLGHVYKKAGVGEAIELVALAYNNGGFLY